MKKIFNLALVAALAIGVVSCSKDSVDDGLGYDAENNSDKLTFVLPANTGGITYATVADADEMVLDLTKTSIYMFGASDELEAVITDIQVGSSAGKTTATIAKNKAWEGKKNFIFVGNNTRASQLPKTVPTSPAMALSDFQEILTDAHSAAAPLATPLMLTSALKEVTDIKTAPAVIAGDVSLYRNVARFDIDNNVSVGNVEIKKVYVNDAKLDGYVFGYQNATIGGTTIGDLEFAVAAPVSTLVVDNSGVDDVYNDLQQEEHLFYIYPTEVKADNSATTLQLVGSVNGVDKIFSLRKYDVDGVTPVDLTIEPNKRYIISAIDALTQTFTLVVADWEEGESIVGKPDATGGTFGMAGLSAGSVGTFNGFATIKVPTAGGVVKFAMKASSKAGTSFVVSNGGSGAMVDVSTAIEGNVTETPGAVVYARPYYESNYEVVVPAFNANETSVTKITVTDKADDTKTMDVYIYHEAEDGSLIPISEVTFPDAVFRALVETTLGMTGEVNRNQMEGVTNLSRGANETLSNMVIYSVEGIQYFTKLTRLFLPNNNLAQIDLSKNSELIYLNLRNAPRLEELDLSNNNLIETMYLGTMPKLHSLNVTGMTNLQDFTAQDLLIKTFEIPSNGVMFRLALNYCLELIAVNNLSGQTALKECSLVWNTQLPEVDASGCTTLESLYVDRNESMVSLDVSGCSALLLLRLSMCFNVSSIDVSGCSALTHFELHNSNEIQSLDLSDCSALVRLMVNLCTNLSSITLPSVMPDIKELHIAGSLINVFDPSKYPSITVLAWNCPNTSIDLSQNVNLEKLSLNKSALTSLDISKNDKIENLYIPDCPNLENVYVWDTFDTEHPENHFTVRCELDNSPKLKFVHK